MDPADIAGRLAAWTPSMKEYHSGPEISSGFLSTCRRLGLSEAYHGRLQPWEAPTTDTALACGTTLHVWLQAGRPVWAPAGEWPNGQSAKWWTELSESRAPIRVAPPSVEARRGGPWEAAMAEARRGNADVLLLHKDFEKCKAALMSLLRYDTPAKREICSIYRDWEKWPEVSWRWEPKETPGIQCRVRQDLVCRTPQGHWVCPGIKTTTKPVNEIAWWRYWASRETGYREADALYRAGLRNLFGDTPFRQTLIVVRLKDSFKWCHFNLHEKAFELDGLWYNELVPRIQETSERMARGAWYGPEEEGFSLNRKDAK